MTPKELRTLGEAWGGRGWQTKLARRLPSPEPGKPLNARTVRRWAAGDTSIHPAMEEKIRAVFNSKPRKERP